MYSVTDELCYRQSRVALQAEYVLCCYRHVCSVTHIDVSCTPLLYCSQIVMLLSRCVVTMKYVVLQTTVVCCVTEIGVLNLQRMVCCVTHSTG